MLRPLALAALVALTAPASAQTPLDTLWTECQAKGSVACEQIAAAPASTGPEKGVAWFNRAIGFENAAIPAAQAGNAQALAARRAEALTAYGRALRADSTLTIALYNKARLHQGANQKAEALEAYSDVINADPVLAPDALALRARLLISRGDYASAAADAAESIRRRPNAAQGYLVRAEALRRQGNAAMADADEAKGYKLLSPQDRADFSEVGEFSGFARIGLQARPTAARRLAVMFTRAAAAYGFPGATAADAQRAVKELDRAVALASGSPASWQQRGEAHFAARNLAAAGADFEQCLTLTRSGASGFAHTCLHGRGKVREAGGATAQALPDYDAAVVAEGRNGAYRNSACWARAVLGVELDRALADCNEAVRLRPQNAGFLDSRALVKLRKGDLSGAEADYAAAIRAAGSDFPHAQYGRGIARLKLGREDEGRADLAAATNADPTLPGRFATFGLTP